MLAQESQASSAFFNQVLREGKDQAFVVKFDTRVETPQGLTSSRNELASALNQLAIPDEYAALLYSAVRQSSEETMKKQAGRKVLIVLSSPDGKPCSCLSTDRGRRRTSAEQ